MKSNGKLHWCGLETSAEKSVGLWVRKQRSLKLKSLPLNLMNPSQCERGETEDALIVVWAGIFMLQTWVHGVNRMRQVNCTQWAVKAGSSIHVESQFTPQLGSAGAALTEQGSELQSAVPSLFFFSWFQWMCCSGTGSTALWTVNWAPRACKSVSHIWGWLPHCANSLGKIYMGPVLRHGLLSFPC